MKKNCIELNAQVAKLNASLSNKTVPDTDIQIDSFWILPDSNLHPVDVIDNVLHAFKIGVPDLEIKKSIDGMPDLTIKFRQKNTLNFYSTEEFGYTNEELLHYLTTIPS